jgi:HK97 family phage portal protein
MRAWECYDLAVRWPWTQEREEPTAPQPENISQVPQFAAAFLNLGTDISTRDITETGVLGLSAVYRAVSLISGTLASLPLRSLREGDGGAPESVKSVFDDPDGPDGQTAYEWRETLFIHRLLHGNGYALKVRNEAGSLVRLPLVHPVSVQIEEPTPEDHKRGTLPRGGKWFQITLADNTRVRLDANEVWHLPGPSTDGIRGLGLLDLARLSLATTQAGDRAAGNMFSRGALISGLATPDEESDITDDIPEIRRQLNNNVQGVENAGAIAVVNRRLKFTPWTMTASDAQFLQSRQFQIEEVARWTGVPPHLLMQTEKQTSWGTGVEEQNRALGRTVLAPYATSFEQRASRLLQSPRWVEFDFAGLERPSPDKEIELLIKQVQAGLLTRNEARKIRNLPPLPETAPNASGNGGAQDEEAGDAPPTE